MDHVKELHEEKIKEEKIANIQEQQEKIIAVLKKIEMKEDLKFSNWRRDLENLDEGMTTASLGMVNYPAEGNVDLGTAISSFTLSGAGVGGFNATTTDISGDSTEFDTMVIRISTSSSEWVIEPGNSIIGLASGGSGSHTVVIPRTYSSLYFSSKNDGSFTASVSYQRRAPVNVFVSLDSPEANAFIRTDPLMQGLSSEEKMKKLKDMLDAGNEYLLKQLGITGSSAKPFDTTMPDSWEQSAQNSSMDIQVGDERITKVDGKTKTDTTRGIEDGKIDGKDFNTQPKPQPQSDSKKQTKELSFDDKIKGTWADPEYRAKEIADVKARAYDPNAPFAKGGVGDPEWMDQQAEKAIAKAKGEIAKNISKPVPNVNDSDKAELEKNIEASLKQLEIDNEQLKGDSLKRNITTAIELGLDVLTVASILATGDGSGALALAASKAGVKAGVKKGVTTGVKTAVQTSTKTAAQRTTIDAFRTQVTSPSTLAKAQDAINKAGKFSKDVAIPIKVQGKTINVKANEILRNKGFQVNSYKPQGEVLSEKKKLKSVKDITSKIPGYYDGKPAPLGFPIQEPPKMVNGRHPDLVDGKNIANRYNRLDPISAKSMPKTGNPHIDKKVSKARMKSK